MNIIEFLEKELKLDGKLMSSGWYRARCPLHNDKNPSFGVYTHYPYHFNCFACEKAGQISYLVAKLKGFSMEKATDFVKSKIKLIIDPNRLFSNQKRFVEIIPDTLVKAYHRSLSNSQTLKYCRSRGVPKFILDTLGVGHDSLNFRMMVPIRSLNDGRVLGFDTRGFCGVADEIEKKILVPPNYKNIIVMAPKNYKKAKGVILVEGFFDLARILLWLTLNNISDLVPMSFCGAYVSDEQLRLLSKFDKIILGCDDDDAGDKTIARVKARIGSIPLFRLSFDGKDPGESKLSSFTVKVLI